ncbi:acyl-CoA thioesterase II [Aeromicrobium sp. Leaf350]|uniref:acyl-CoA thioesterase n=1 Tax=Aeromicrobium sp. Leaf350 TaxID=2876565 RepID=UPI001E4CD269|nr:thioesterase family protein [Aeromicrobium sp. Leaf350]
MSVSTDPSIADVLAGTVTDLGPFHGFGGLHGGLMAGLLLREARRRAGSGRVPVETTVHFLRPSLTVPDLTGDLLLDGRSTAVATTSATSSGAVTATATSVLSTPRAGSTPGVTAGIPEDIVPLDQAELFVIPAEFVPISTRMQVRPATPALPFTGAPHPRLSAWIRLTEPVPDPYERLLLLADTLPPSYAAILTEMHLVPSVRITVRFTPAVATTAFEWVLVSAETVEADDDGWLSEELRIWAADGTLLATSTQLRAVR